MDWIELTIHTTTAGADIVSEALMAEGATGTMVEDRADIPDPDKPNGYWEIIDPNLIASMPEDVLVHAWFTPDSSFADRMQALRSRCDELHHMDLGLDLGTLEISTLNVRDEDWAEVWKKFYKPFKAGRSLVVKPTWEHYEPQPGDRIFRVFMSLKLMKILPFSDIIYNRKLTEVSRWKYPTNLYRISNRSRILSLTPTSARIAAEILKR